jgi:phosphopantetheine adenylyltransferase
LRRICECIAAAQNSSLVKEVTSLGGDITGLVPPDVVTALASKYH